MSKRGIGDNPTAQGRLREREKMQREQADDDLRQVLSTAVGRRVFFEIIFRRTGLLEPTYRGEEHANMMFHREGVRYIGRSILDDVMRVAPDAYLAMWAEGIQRSNDDSIHRRAAEDDAKKEEPTE